MDCPICFETLDTNVNCIKTSCGHAFHANCLMKHTAHNGYTCPYCRDQMIEEPEIGDSDEESEYYDSDDEDAENPRPYNYGIFDVSDEEETLYSFRWFHQRLNNEELEEDEYQLSTRVDQGEVIYNENKDQVKNLTETLQKINKLSYEKLLAAFLWGNCKDFKYNYFAEEMNYEVSHMIDDIHERMVRVNSRV